MRLTPLDIREQQFRRVMRGVDAEEVQQFLTAVAGEFETLVGSNNDLRQRVVELEEKITEYRNMEKALRDTLLTAEKVMGDAKESAQREASLILREAELAAERTRGRVTGEMQRLQDELAGLRRLKDAYVARVRWLLRSHLELLEGSAHEFSEIDSAMGQAAASEPSRDTPARGRPSPGGPAAPGWPAGPSAPERPTPEPPPRAVAQPPVWTQPPPQVELWRYPQAPPPVERRGTLADVRGAGAEVPPGAPETRPVPPELQGPLAGRGPLPGGSGEGTRAGEARPPLLEPEEWRLVGSASPMPPGGALDDVMRPVEPDGTYGAPPLAEPPRALSDEEIAQAARRAERLAAEARAALERHGLAPPAGGGWPEERGRGAPPPSRP